MNFIAAQIIGFIGTGLLVFSYQFKESKKLFIVQMFSNIAYILHFFMLGAFSGSINIAIALVRNFVLINSSKGWSRNKYWLWLFISLHIIVTIFTYQDMFSLLPCIGMVAITIASWTRNGKKIRMTNIFVNSPSWLIYDIYTVSYSGIVCEVLTLLSVIISFFRHGVKALDQADY
ncbi:MAG: YgjV family protein [Tissierellia bacterium]|nr:YgjV family protein [Tissierellia bacterium]